jgi:hypothetical protein
MAEIAKAVAYIVKAVTMANNVFFVDSAEVDPSIYTLHFCSLKSKCTCVHQKEHISTQV